MKNIILQFLWLTFFSLSLPIMAQTRITYEYDQQGRLVSEEVENQYKATFQYDIEGNLGHKHAEVLTNINEVFTEIGIQNNFLFYPNPVDDTFIIESLQEAIIKGVLITDINGRLGFRMNYNSNQEEVDISSLLPGIYFVTIVSENKSEIFKLLKK